MKATLTFPNGDVLKLDDSQTPIWSPSSPHAQLALREAQKETGDVRRQVDYLISKYRVKVSDAVPPPSLP
ncbi:hypothetical protein P0G11_14465, partial [Adlercreutzia rubneri]|uniref:hypothetical protein n=1 Tax=Adlercreutzia rubneri TaxID=2916441 RepID=UPI0023AEF5EA